MENQVFFFFMFISQQMLEDNPVHIKQPFSPQPSTCNRKENQKDELSDDNNLSNVEEALSCRIPRWALVVATFLVIL